MEHRQGHNPPFDTVTMEDIDRVANRMTISSVAGLVGGATMAIHKGSPVLKSSVSVAMSCALVSTACFGIERLSNVALRSANVADPSTAFYASHALGGSVGGALTGALFQSRMMPGVLLFTPAMVLVAFGEIQFEKARQARLLRLLREIDETEQQKS